jgi:hypothetical protein
MLSIGVITSTINRIINKKKSAKILKGIRASLKKNPKILMMGAISIPKIPGFRKNPMNLLNGEDIEIM